MYNPNNTDRSSSSNGSAVVVVTVAEYNNKAVGFGFEKRFGDV